MEAAYVRFDANTRQARDDLLSAARREALATKDPEEAALTLLRAWVYAENIGHLYVYSENKLASTVYRILLHDEFDILDNDCIQDGFFALPHCVVSFRRVPDDDVETRPALEARVTSILPRLLGQFEDSQSKKK